MLHFPCNIKRNPGNRACRSIDVFDEPFEILAGGRVMAQEDLYLKEYKFIVFACYYTRKGID